MRPARILPLLIRLLRVSARARLVAFIVTLVVTVCGGALLFSLLTPRDAAEAPASWRMPDLAPMGDTLMLTWRDDQRGAVRLGGRNAGRWRVSPVSLGGEVDASTRPRIDATTQGGLIAWIGRGMLHVGRFDREGLRSVESLSIAGGSADRARSLPPPVVLAARGGGNVLYSDGRTLWMMGVSPLGLSEPRPLARGGAFDAVRRGRVVHVALWRAAPKRTHQLVHLRVSGAEMEERVLLEDRQGPVALSASGRLGLVRSRPGATCVILLESLHPVRHGTTRSTTTAEARAKRGRAARRGWHEVLGPGEERCVAAAMADLDLSATEKGWLVLGANRFGVQALAGGASLRSRGLDARGREVRLADAGPDLYAAAWVRPGALHVALLGPDGRLRHEGDLRP